jgi:hypothetical protein
VDSRTSNLSLVEVFKCTPPKKEGTLEGYKGYKVLRWELDSRTYNLSLVEVFKCKGPRGVKGFRIS